MILTALYLITLLLAPQIWLQPFVGMRIDILIFLAWFIYIFLTGKALKTRFGHQEILLTLWITWIFISVLVSGDFSQRTDLLIYVVKCYFVYFLVKASLDSSASIKGTVSVLVFLCLLLGVEGIQQFNNDIGWAGQTLGWASEGAKGRTRWVGIFDGPGVFCVVYTIALPFVVHYFFSIKSIFKKCITAVTFCMLSLAIYYNGSRGGFVATLCILAGYVLYKYKNKIAIIVGVLLLVALIKGAPSHITNLSDNKHSSSHRVDMWAKGTDMLEHNPIFGVGKGGFKEYSGTLIAHNSFVENMAETGFVGVFFWVGLLYANIKGLIAACLVKDEDTQTMAVPLTLSLLGYLASAMFVTLEYETLYFMLGLSAAFTGNLGIDIRLVKNDILFVFAIVIGFYVVMKLFVTFIGSSAFS